MNDFEIEKKKLDEILSEYNEYTDNLKLEYKNVYRLCKNSDEAEERKFYLEKRINIVNQNAHNPYFARIDFLNEENIKDICYIGKIGLSNYDNEIVTIDWRAPIASLYYDSNIGNATYKVEDKIIYGNLLLKRQYNIENKTLLSFNDVDIVSNDELLKPYLGVSSDVRLKNIVATIQNEQNQIIRSNICNNLIVQGVAGSGKTTVALHRIAYLAYNYRNIYKNTQYMVIGPNKFFINYISSVLPDLDVYDVKQYDLNTFANIYLNQKLQIEQGYTANSKNKSLLSFKSIIDEYIKHYSDNIICEDIKIKRFVLLTKKEINDEWQNLNYNNYEVLKDRIERCILLLNNKIMSRKYEILFKINDFYDNELKNSGNLEVVRIERTSTLDDFKNINSILKKYFKKALIQPIKLYKQILETLNNYDYINLYYEDIAPLMYVNYKLLGADDYKKIKHIVIDEAQDYNQFTFYILKKIFSSATFSIYGDLAQCLYPYRSLNNWDSLNDVFDSVEIKYLNKSYRTSIEIMAEANKINRFLNLTEAEAVIRHSDNVIYHKIRDYYFDLANNLNLLISKGLSSIAIIVKNEHEMSNIYNLSNKKFSINIIDENNNEYKGGICIITSRLSKGLEFDGVIIANASDKNYCVSSILDMKLLYVSMTRAMHSLIVMYDDNLVSVLNS